MLCDDYVGLTRSKTRSSAIAEGTRERRDALCTMPVEILSTAARRLQLKTNRI